MSQSTQRPRPGPQDLEWYRSMHDTNPVWRDPETGVWNHDALWATFVVQALPAGPQHLPPRARFRVPGCS